MSEENGHKTTRSIQQPNMGKSRHFEEALYKEIIRKLSLAAQAGHREQKDIVLREILQDITGTIDHSAGKAFLVFEGKQLNNYYYEILSEYLVEEEQKAFEVIKYSKQSWNNPYMLSVYTLLLYRWIFNFSSNNIVWDQIDSLDSNKNGHNNKNQNHNKNNNDNGHSKHNNDKNVSNNKNGTNHRSSLSKQSQLEIQPLISVLLQGIRQLFDLDLAGNQFQFRAVHLHLVQEYLLKDTAQKNLRKLHRPRRLAILISICQMLPYYIIEPEAINSSSRVTNQATMAHKENQNYVRNEKGQLELKPKTINDIIFQMPVQNTKGMNQSGYLASLKNNNLTGPDIFFHSVSDMMCRLQYDSTIVTYLDGLLQFRPLVQSDIADPVMKLRFQDELYQMTISNGTRLYNRQVCNKAYAVLNELYPLGRTSRIYIRYMFYFLHSSVNIFGFGVWIFLSLVFFYLKLVMRFFYYPSSLTLAILLQIKNLIDYLVGQLRDQDELQKNQRQAINEIVKEKTGRSN